MQFDHRLIPLRPDDPARSLGALPLRLACGSSSGAKPASIRSTQPRWLLGARRHFGSRLAREAGLLPMQEREVDMVVTARRQFMPNELRRYSAQLDRVSAQRS